MAVFTELAESDFRQILAHFSLGELVAFQGISNGIENSNFFLDTTGGRWVLTVFERLRPDELPFYLELMHHLAGKGLAVPDPQRTRSGALFALHRGKALAIANRLPGSDGLVDTTPRECALVGDMLARLHVAAADAPVEQPNLRGIDWQEATVPQVLEYIPEELRGLLRDELAHQIRVQRGEAWRALPSGAVHCDLFRNNLLMENIGQADERIGGVIDFYFAGCTAWLYDLAVVVNDWCVDLASGAVDPQRARALLAAYNAVRPLRAEEAALWQDALRAGALRFWISRLYDFYRPRPASLLKPHDPAHFERILKLRRDDPNPVWVP